MKQPRDNEVASRSFKLVSTSRNVEAFRLQCGKAGPTFGPVHEADERTSFVI
jgi:hypothetical protein